jgi:hypothetical protein
MRVLECLEQDTPSAAGKGFRGLSCSLYRGLWVLFLEESGCCGVDETMFGGYDIISIAI